MASGATYNVTRFTRQVLKRYRRSPPSVVVHLYEQHFRFEHQHGTFGYDSPMKCFLESIREQKLPTDLLDVLDHAQVKYYDGCLIVEVHDHRHPSTTSSSTLPPAASVLPPSKLFTFSVTPSSRVDSAYHQHAEVYRIVLAPNPATLWTDLALSGHTASAERAAEMESIILNRTVPPLCLDPSIQTSRIANSMLRATTLRPPKRKRFCNSGECDDDDIDDDGAQDRDVEEHYADGGDARGDEPMTTTGTAAAAAVAATAPPTKADKDRYEKLMRTGDEGIAKLKGPAFSRLAFIQSYRERQSNPHATLSSGTGGGGGGGGAPPTNSLKAQPGSAITSIRLGASQTAAAGGGGANSRGQSPAVGTSSSAASRPLKKRSHAGGGGGGGGGDLSDGATSTASLQSSSTNAKKVKKSSSSSTSAATAAAAAAGGLIDGHQQASLEKKQQKLNQKRRDKERKRLEQQQQQQQQQQQMQMQQHHQHQVDQLEHQQRLLGQSSIGANAALSQQQQQQQQAKFTWSGS